MMHIQSGFYTRLGPRESCGRHALLVLLCRVARSYDLRQEESQSDDGELRRRSFRKPGSRLALWLVCRRGPGFAAASSTGHRRACNPSPVVTWEMQRRSRPCK